MKFNNPVFRQSASRQKAVKKSGVFLIGSTVRVVGCCDVEAFGKLEELGGREALVSIDGRREWFPLSCVELV